MNIRYVRDNYGDYYFDLVKVIFDDDVSNISINHAQQIVDAVQSEIHDPIEKIFVTQYTHSKFKVICYKKRSDSN